MVPLGAVLEKNTYQPKTKLSYSDAKGAQIYNLPKIEGRVQTEKLLTFANISSRDVKAIAAIEAQVYPEDMVQGEEHIEEILQQSRQREIPGAAASFYVREGKEIAGYTLLLLDPSEFQTGQQAAHVYDMAVLPQFRGGKVMFQMWERILETAKTYDLPIEAEARSNTTYALLENKRVQKWLEKRGFTRTQTKQLPNYLGDEDFYLVRLEQQPN